MLMAFLPVGLMADSYKITITYGYKPKTEYKFNEYVDTTNTSKAVESTKPVKSKIEKDDEISGKVLTNVALYVIALIGAFVVILTLLIILGFVIYLPFPLYRKWLYREKT